MAANPNIYPYTPDDSKLFQICDLRMHQISQLIGSELETSIWLGEITNPAYNIADTTLLGIGAHLDPPHIDDVKFSRRSNKFWGLCTDYNIQYYLNNWQWQKQFVYMSSNNSDATNWSFQRERFNSERWTDKETVYSTDDYSYKPIVKLCKGAAVAYFTIGAYKEVPDTFTTFNDFYNWMTNPANYTNVTPEQYQNVKATYPNVLAITMFVKCGATAGSSRETNAILFFPQDCKAVGEVGAMWNLEEFSELFQRGDKYYLSSMSYGVIPQGAKVFNYVPNAYIYSGACCYQYTTQTLTNSKTNTAWSCRLGISGTDRVKYVEIAGCPRAGFMTFTDFDTTKLVDIATSLGLAATTADYNVAQNGSITTDPRIYTPEYDENGNITGKTNDSDTKTIYVLEGQNGEPIQPNFDPSADEDDEIYPETDPSEDQKTDEVTLPTATLSSYGVFNRSYVMTKSQAQDLSDYLWNTDPTTFAEILEDLRLVGDNRMNSIISMIMFPFEIPRGEDLHQVRIGRHTAQGVVARYLDDTNLVFDMGECYLYAQYQNFLDYEPYTQSWLYVPFCGVFKISSQQFMNKYIHVKLAVDLITGAGQAVVYAGGIPVIYKNCRIGMQIPVTGADSGYTIRNYIQGGAAILSGAAMVDLGNPVWGAMSAVSGLVNFLSAQNAPIESVGASSPQCGMLMPNKCYFIVERPKPLLKQVQDYGSLIGFACYKSGTINEFVGFSKFENVKLDFSSANEFEKSEIRRLLKEGVYL